MDGSETGNGAAKGTFLEFIEEYTNVDQAVAEAVAMRKDLRKRIKGAGFNLAALDRARKLSQSSGEKRDAEDQHLRRYMEWLGKPLGFQAAMGFMANPTDQPKDAADVAPHQVHRVEDHGRVAAERGEPRTANPWSPGTFLCQIWDSQWLAATAKKEAAEEKGNGAAAAAPTAAEPPVKRKGGRPKGAKDKHPRNRYRRQGDASLPGVAE